MKRFEVLLLISTMIDKGKAIRVNMDEHSFRLERQKDYDIWHDETDSKAAFVVYEADIQILNEWLQQDCEDVKFGQHLYSFYK